MTTKTDSKVVQGAVTAVLQNIIDGKFLYQGEYIENVKRVASEALAKYEEEKDYMTMFTYSKLFSSPEHVVVILTLLGTNSLLAHHIDETNDKIQELLENDIKSLKKYINKIDVSKPTVSMTKQELDQREREIDLELLALREKAENMIETIVEMKNKTGDSKLHTETSDLQTSVSETMCSTSDLQTSVSEATHSTSNLQKSVSNLTINETHVQDKKLREYSSYTTLSPPSPINESFADKIRKSFSAFNPLRKDSSQKVVRSSSVSTVSTTNEYTKVRTNSVSSVSILPELSIIQTTNEDVKQELTEQQKLDDINAEMSSLEIEYDALAEKNDTNAFFPTADDCRKQKILNRELYLTKVKKRLLDRNGGLVFVDTKKLDMKLKCANDALKDHIGSISFDPSRKESEEFRKKLLALTKAVHALQREKRKTEKLFSNNIVQTHVNVESLKPTNEHDISKNNRWYTVD